jgi:hypothetical protein
MEEGNLAILVDAKTEYTKQLINILKNSLYLGIKEIYINSKEKCIENENDILSVFQVNLSEIPKWNQDIINTKTDTVVKDSGCDWIEDLITAVFVSHTRILTSINFSKNKKKINLKIPKVDHFIHQCYVDVARYFWKNPYLYDDDIGSYEYQRNRREAETIIENSIGETIRKQLPVKHILKEYLGNEYNDEESGESDDVTKNIPEKYQENLRKMVKAEILQCSNENQNKVTFDGDDKELIKDEPLDLDLSNNIIETTEIVDPVVSINDTTSFSEVTSDAPISNDEPILSLPPSSPSDSTTLLENSTVTSPPTTDPINEVETTESINTLTSPTVTENLSMDTPSKEVTSSAPTDINLDSMINTELNNVKKTDDLVIEELDLDMDDLSKLEEVYIDSPSSVSAPPANLTMKTEQIDLNEFSTGGSRPETPIAEEKEQVKTIVLDTNEEIKKQLKKKDFSFFDDAEDN